MTRLAHPCAVLNLDPGKHSGAALMLQGELICARTAKTQADREHVVAASIRFAESRSVPLIVVAEKWAGGAGRNKSAWRTPTVAGLGASWGMWQAEIERAKIPKSRIVRVWQGTWKARVLGGPMGRSSAAWDEACIRYVRAVFPSAKPEALEPDAATAIVIGVWSSYAAEVAKAIPKRAQKARAA